MKKKTYVLTVSEFFPKTHPRAGQRTNFVESIANGTKLHTIRSNYPLWRKRFDRIDAGEAVLSVRVWEGKPYKSKQREVFRLETTDGIRVQPITQVGFRHDDILCWRTWDIAGIRFITTNTLAKNDGLSLNDFNDWFKDYDLATPMAVIHFGPFRY